jgi:hypothetical protein
LLFASHVRARAQCGGLGEQGGFLQIPTGSDPRRRLQDVYPPGTGVMLNREEQGVSARNKRNACPPETGVMFIREEQA